MKKTLLAAALLCFSSMAAAAGEYDGIWSFDAPIRTGYYSIHQNGTTLIVASLDAHADGGWAANQGTLIGSVASLTQIHSTFASGGSMTWKIEFTNNTHGAITLTHCTPPPGFNCNPIGTSWAIVKIF